MEAAGLLFEKRFIDLRDEPKIEKSPHLPLPDTESDTLDEEDLQNQPLPLTPAHCE